MFDNDIKLIFKNICPNLTYRSQVTNQCISCIISSNCNGCDPNTGICNSCVQNFTLNTTDFQCYPESLDSNVSDTINATNFVNETNSTNVTDINSTNSSASNNNTNITNITNNNGTNSTIFYQNQQIQLKTISSIQAFIVKVNRETFNIFNPIIGLIYSIIQMSPFVLNFINFMNYWKLCCLYSILDVKVPSYLPQIHKQIFQGTQTSIFQNIGFSPKLQSLNNQRVPSNHYIVDYNIYLDFINPNIQNFLMILFLLVLLLATICFRNFIKKKSEFVFNLLQFNALQSLIGQFISFIPFTLLPYSFLINQTGLLNFYQKLNIILQVFLLILCFLAPCIFIWSRSQTYIENKVKKSKLFKKISRNQLKRKILIQKAKSIDKKAQNQNFKELQMLMINISVPFLIILPVYFPFFIVNLSIFLFGIRKASKSTKYRINSIISACYLPLYHSCYIIFYLFGQNEYICHYVGLFCLVVLLFGCLHEFCNVGLLSLIDFFKWLIKTSKQHCLSSKISNQQTNFKNSKSKQIQQNIQLSDLNFKINKKFSSNNLEEIQSKKHSIKLKWNNNISNNIDQPENQIQGQKITKNKVKKIKFKTEKVYKRDLNISKTLKVSIKSSFKLSKKKQNEKNIQNISKDVRDSIKFQKNTIFQEQNQDKIQCQ